MVDQNNAATVVLPLSRETAAQQFLLSSTRVEFMRTRVVNKSFFENRAQAEVPLVGARTRESDL